MTLEAKIIRDLQSGKTSINALALRMKSSENLCRIVLNRLVATEMVVAEVIDCGITVYRLVRW